MSMADVGETLGQHPGRRLVAREVTSIEAERMREWHRYAKLRDLQDDEARQGKGRQRYPGAGTLRVSV